MSNFLETVCWLVQAEKLAHKTYSTLLDFLDEDPKLTPLLTALAEDELLHHQVMKEIHEYVKSNTLSLEHSIKLDQTTKNRILTPFHRLEQKIQGDCCTQEEILEAIFEAEFSEWNALFTFVIRSMAAFDQRYEKLLHRMQNHLDRIVEFLKEAAKPLQMDLPLDKLKALNPKKLLVVDDNTSVLEIFASILEDVAHVDTTDNAASALELMQKHYYDGILSDINMPDMDGIELFKEAIKHRPGIQNRFIFITGMPVDSNLSFFEKENIPVLKKPVDIETLKKTIRDLLDF